MNLDEHIKLSERILNQEYDAQLAIYVLRDLPETESAGLRDIAWSMHQHGTVTKEVQWFIQELRKWQKNNPE